MKLIRRVFNSAVAWFYAATLVRLGGAALLLPLMIIKLPVEHLGLWYVFQAMAGLLQNLDMGVSQSATRTTGYLWAGAGELRGLGIASTSLTQSEKAGSPTPNYRLLSDTRATLSRFYHAVGLVLLVPLLFAFAIYVRHKAGVVSEGNWAVYAWWVLAASCAIRFTGAFWSAMLIGINGVRQAEQNMLKGVSVNYITAAIGLFLGLGLWSLVIGNLVMSVVYRASCKASFVRMAGPNFRACVPRFSMKLLAVVWPTSWRAGLMSLGQQLMLNGTTLVCSIMLGLKTTAAYGLSMQMGGIALQFSNAWLRVKLPLLNQLRAAGNPAQAVNVFRKRRIAAWGCFLVAAFTIWSCGNPGLRFLGSQNVLLSRGVLGFLLLGLGLDLNRNLCSQFVMTANVNPFWHVWLMSGLLTAGLGIVLSPVYGARGIVAAMVAVELFVNLYSFVRTLPYIKLAKDGAVQI